MKVTGSSGLCRLDILLLLCGIVVVAVLSTVLRNDLVWDDAVLLKTPKNPGQLQDLRHMLTVPFWENSGLIFSSISAYWRP